MIAMNQSNSLQLFYVLVLLLLSLYARASFGEANIKCIERERQALLTFKKGLIDDCRYLSSWRSKEDKDDCCKWRGVHCDNLTGHVLMLNLNTFQSDCVSKPLRGNISSSLLQLQHLNYLDLHSNDFGGHQIPEFIGSLTKLRFLDLSAANFSGTVPYQLGNLTNLQSLHLGENELHVSKLEWLSNLHKLEHLHLEFLNLKEATDWLQVISGLPSLTDLSLASSTLPTIISRPSLSLVNSSTSLSHLDLSSCGLSNSAYQWLSSISSNLLTLVLADNQLQGPIPDYAFLNVNSLMHLDLTYNQITGISKSLTDMCSLKILHLSRNNLTGQLPDLFFNLSGCSKKSLESSMLDNNKLSGSLPDITEFSSLRELDVSYNKLDGSFPEKFGKPSPLVELDLKGNLLWGSLPDLSVFPSLRTLDIGDNRLNGTISAGLGQLSKLKRLVLSSNSFQGTITETHLSNLSKLKSMEFSHNPQLAINLGPDWVPPFHLDHIGLRNCKVGPHFPKWLRNQKSYFHLDISIAGISDSVPTWFWDLPPNFKFLNLSYNHIKGRVPDLCMKSTGYPRIDLSSNNFEGPIPQISPNVTSLSLFKNKFSGSISRFCATTLEHLLFLDLSENQLSGEIPHYCNFWQELLVLNLANNNFSGQIPNSMGPSCKIISLHLRNNILTGELPSSLKNCVELKVVELGDNKISGTIPAWLGESQTNLVALGLRSNHISGNVPPQLCFLKKVQVLDFSRNNISGTVPKCLNNLTAMVPKKISNLDYPFPYKIHFGRTFVEYQEQVLLLWKGMDCVYKNTLALVKSIDFSSNKLSGNIPEEITSLVGLISLNLSRNNLTGTIPTKIGQLTLLNSLDLSQNGLLGKIPECTSQFSHLGVLNLSNNNLYGKIPSCTQLQSFDASSYMGNPELCGLPLPKCPGEEPPAHQVPAIIVHESEEDGFITRGFYISASLGFIICFWGVGGTLVLNKKWRHAYFQFLNHVEDKLYVWIAVKMANLQRRLRN